MIVAYRNHLTVEPEKVIDRITMDKKDARVFSRRKQLDIFVLS